jgi:hypothetical protein
MKWQIACKLVMVLLTKSHSRVGFHEVCARWVPEQLTVLHKQTRLGIFQQHLDRCGNERDAFRLVTGDETWIHHCESESKRQSTKLKHPQ